MLPSTDGMRLMDLALARVQDVVETAFRNVSDEMMNIPESKIQEFIENVINPLSRYIFDNLPCDLLSLTHTAICDRLQCVMYQLNPISNYELSLMYLIGFHERLSELKMCIFPVDTNNPMILNNLNNMQEMIRFRNEFTRSYFFDPYPSVILPCTAMSLMLNRFTNVTELTLRRANDIVLGKVLTACKKLTKLDVAESFEVTDHSIYNLIKATQLRILDLTFTRISVLGYMILFNKLKDVMYFGDSFPLLAVVEDAIRRNQSGFGLRRAILKIDAPMTLPDLSKVVPLLRYLEIIMNGSENGNFMIPYFQQLGNLNLTHITVHRAAVGRMIQYLPGGTVLNSLKSLEIYFAPDVNVEALKLLDVVCPNLETLKLRLCSEQLQMFYNFEDCRVFKNLREFQCESTTLTAWVYGRILTNCHNIRTIVMKNCPTFELNNRWLEMLMRENLLKKLESISINRCQITEDRLTELLLDGTRNVKQMNVTFQDVIQGLDPRMVLETFMDCRLYIGEVIRTLRLMSTLVGGPTF